MEKLTKDDPEFFSKISRMRKVKSGGKTFIDKDKARAAQAKGVAAKLRKSRERTDGED